MSSPEAEDISLSPECTGFLDQDMAAEHTTDHRPDDASPTANAAASKTAASAKDPLRPRRKKARRACFACQRAHLTCGDERPCNRCIKRNLQDHCTDGVRKKAKYLHDAPDGVLTPGVGGHYPYMNGNRPAPLPISDQHAVPVVSQSNIYAQTPSTTHFASHSVPVSLPVSQNGHTFSSQQSPISPSFSQGHHHQTQNVSSTIAQGQAESIQQYGPLFDPSDPALFNFDISSLNFGNHYGALEFGMLGHMSSGATEQAYEKSLMNPMNQAVNMFHQSMGVGYEDLPNQGGALSFSPSGLPASDRQESRSQSESMQIQTSNDIPAAPYFDHYSHQIDSLNGPHAFAIGQGPSSHSTDSPRSTDAPGFENDNLLASATIFGNQKRPHVQTSPASNQIYHENKAANPVFPSTPLHDVRKRQRNTRSIYQGITKPYDYVKGYHRLYTLIKKKYSAPWVAKAQEYLQNYRPVLLQVREELNTDDLIHQEMGLQRNLMTLQEHFAEVGTPFLICRRSGEVVGINKEFTILTGWKREVLLGYEQNLNVNVGINRDVGVSELPTQNTTPNLGAQDAETGILNVNIIELMDGRSALEFLQHFSELCYQDSRGHASQRVNMLRYQTRPDIDRMQEKTEKSNSDAKCDPYVRMDDSVVHQGESAIQKLSAKNGMVDCMIWWHIKRDIFDMPVLVCMSVMPVLEKGLQ